MGFVEWAAKMRKRPVAERQQFVVFWTFVIMIIVAAAWFTYFFKNVADEMKAGREYEEAKQAIPMTFNERKPTPFPLDF